MLGRQLCAQEEEGNGIVGAAGSQHQPCGVDLGAHTDRPAPPYVRTSRGWVAAQSFGRLRMETGNPNTWAHGSEGLKQIISTCHVLHSSVSHPPPK